MIYIIWIIWHETFYMVVTWCQFYNVFLSCNASYNVLLTMLTLVLLLVTYAHIWRHPMMTKTAKLNRFNRPPTKIRGLHWPLMSIQSGVLSQPDSVRIPFTKMIEFQCFLETFDYLLWSKYKILGNLRKIKLSNFKPRNFVHCYFFKLYSYLRSTTNSQ